MLEKGKGLMLGKLWTMQLIESNLQLLVNIFINERKKIKIENDKWISNINYRSRSRYSIKDIILEK